MPYEAGLKIELEMEAWASNPNVSFEELREIVLKSGNVILEEYPETGFIKIGYSREEVNSG